MAKKEKENKQVEKTSEKEFHLKDVNEAKKKLDEIGKDASLNKPKPEEVEEAAKEFDEAKKNFEKKTFEIGSKDQALKFYDFVLDFMENHVYWTKNGWMGVLKMHEELTEAKKNYKEGDKFAIGYQALEFMFYALTNPGGTGLKSAKAVEKIADWYAEVIEMSAKVLEKAREELKEIQWLGDKAAAMQQGFYLEKEDGTEEKNNEQNFKGPSADDLIKGNKK